MRFFQSPELPRPAGHYSQAVQVGDFVFVSGVLPDADLVGFEAQVTDALRRCEQVLESAGCHLGDVAQCTAYIVGVEHWAAFNACYAAAFGAHKPARAVVPVPELHHGCLVELVMTAWKPPAV